MVIATNQQTCSIRVQPAPGYVSPAPGYVSDKQFNLDIVKIWFYGALSSKYPDGRLVPALFLSAAKWS